MALSSRVIALNEREVYLLGMSYPVSSRLQMAPTPVVTCVRDALAEEGFGVLMDLNIQQTLLSLAVEGRDRLSAALERAGRPE